MATGGSRAPMTCPFLIKWTVRVIDILTGNKGRWGFSSEDVNGLVGIVDTAQLITTLSRSCCQGKIQGKFDRIPASITNFSITY